MENIIKIRFIGGGMAPGEMSPSDMAKLMKAMNALAPAGEGEIVGLSSVESESLGLWFKAGVMALAVYTANIDLIAAGDFQNFSKKTINAINDVSDIAKRNNCKAVLSTSDKDATADIDASTEAKFGGPTLKSHTTFAGKVINIGGKETPKAKILLSNGKTLSCNISVENAKGLAELLYEHAHITGEGKWDVRNKSWLSFNIESFKHFPKKPILQMFDELRAKIGADALDHFDDTVGYFRAIRDGDVP